MARKVPPRPSGGPCLPNDWRGSAFTSAFVPSRTAGEILRSARATSDAVVTSGDAPYDALSVGPYAYAHCAPIVLCRQGLLTDQEVQGIRSDAGLARVILGGGTAAVSDQVMAQLGDGYDYVRLAGANRYETSVRVADFAVGEGLAWSAPVVASGRALPTRSPLLLVNDAGDATVKALWEHAGNTSAPCGCSEAPGRCRMPSWTPSPRP